MVVSYRLSTLFHNFLYSDDIELFVRIFCSCVKRHCLFFGTAITAMARQAAAVTWIVPPNTIMAAPAMALERLGHSNPA